MDTHNAVPDTEDALSLDTLCEYAQLLGTKPADLRSGHFLPRFPIITSEHMTRAVQRERSWGERLLSWPWRPWRRTKTVSVPLETALFVEGKLVMHPAIAQRLKSAVEVVAA